MILDYSEPTRAKLEVVYVMFSPISMASSLGYLIEGVTIQKNRFYRVHRPQNRQKKQRKIVISRTSRNCM
jgi:hypothetical protein